MTNEHWPTDRGEPIPEDRIIRNSPTKTCPFCTGPLHYGWCDEMRAERERVGCSRCGGSDMMLCDCSLPSRVAAPARDGPGWIVGNGAGTCWRMWKLGNPVWTNDRTKATRYARREDAEAVHAEDEDAWSVVPYSTAPASDEAAVEAAARAVSRTVNPWDADGDQWEGYVDETRAAITAYKLARPASDEAAAPWANYHGDIPDYDHPLRCVYESGIQYAVKLLAKMLKVDDYEVCDGTEEFDGDLGGTLFNIVLAAMPKDEHGDSMHPDEARAALAAAAPMIRAQDAWQPIETAPEYPTGCIVHWICESSGLPMISIAYKMRGGWCSPDDGTINPTHWMPLPAPPIDRGEVPAQREREE